MPRDDAERGLRLPRRPCAAAVRSPAARRGAPLRVRDRRLSGDAGREVDRGRLQQRHLRRAARAAGVARGSRDRRDHARGRRCRARDPQPPHRTARNRGDRRRRTLRAADPLTRRRRALHSGRVPEARAADRGGRADGRRRQGVRGSARTGRLRHRDPRLHALPADPPGFPARLRSRRDARLLRGGDGARGRRHTRAQRLGERPLAHGRLPFPDDGRAGALPRARRAVPAAAADRGGARHRRRARAGGRMSRHDGRRPDELRPVETDPNFLEQPHGMVLWSQGKTRVLCTASVVEGVPRWLYKSGRGWMTAEYSLLPASTGDRTEREAARGRQGGRTVEIQRLIGRALRAVVDFEALGERTVYLDCDVLQADGGTRCAAICGAYVALARALDRFGLGKALTGSVAAVSVGVVGGEPMLDLDYSEDSTADVDLNVVMTGDGLFVEVQATAEREAFDRARLDELLDLAAAGIERLAAVQDDAIAVQSE